MKTLEYHVIVEEIKSRRINLRLPEEVSLDKTDDWMQLDNGNIVHCSGNFFQVVYFRCNHHSREIDTPWCQPFIRQVGDDGGILGLIVRQTPEAEWELLCNYKYEPGNYGGWQVTSSIQATFDNISAVHGGRRPYLVDYFLSDEAETIFDGWLAEDGGRLYNKRNRGVVKQIRDASELPNDIPETEFFWASLETVKKLFVEDAIISPHLFRLAGIL